MFLKPHQKEEEGQKKLSPIKRFHKAFNVAYDVTLTKYKKGVNLFIKRKWLAFGLVIASVVVLLGLMKITPTGMVPNEDTGTFFVAVSCRRQLRWKRHKPPWLG